MLAHTGPDVQNALVFVPPFDHAIDQHSLRPRRQRAAQELFTYCLRTIKGIR